MTHTSSPATPPEVQRVSLRSLGLRPGMALQTRRLVEGAVKREGQFMGSLESRGVMIGALGPDGEATELAEGDACVVRGFTGQYEFSFLSKVLQTFEKPFIYALLAYPSQVDATMVRQSMRTKVTWPCSVSIPGKTDTPAVTLVDLSLSGAMIKAPAVLANVSEQIQFSLTVDFDGAPVVLSLQAQICHNTPGTGGDGCHVGMAFRGLTQHDKLVLNFATQTQPA